MIFLIKTTQYLLCCISILLTAIFALEIGSVQVLDSQSDFSVKYYTIVFLLISIGLCIDVSKYLFWFYREKHFLFLSLSIVLVFFSWSASIAFFISKEKSSIDIYQLESSKFIANNMAISLLEMNILEKRKLLDKRLSSRHHDQWEKGDEILNEIDRMSTELRKRIEVSDLVGLEDAKLKLSTSELFSTLSSAFSVSLSLIANTAYGLLALIIEVCAIGVMSLVQIISDEKKYANESVSLAHKKNGEKSHRIGIVRDGILSKKIKPIISKIIKDYSISHAEAKKIMIALEQEGKIVIMRNRYYLSG